MASEYTASTDLSIPWRDACRKAMGMVDPRDPKRPRLSSPRRTIPVLQLLPSPPFANQQQAKNETATKDPWMNTALEIQSNIQKMQHWLEQKRPDFVGGFTSSDNGACSFMSEEEASIVQTTVTSFLATTANEIEGLHQLLTSSSNSSPNSQPQQHAAGLVQVLMLQLQQGLAEPFSQYQTMRQRPARQYWQTPLQCRLQLLIQPAPKTRTESDDRSLDELLGLDEADDDDPPPQQDPRFQPSRPCHRLHGAFLETYATIKNNTKALKRPPSIFDTNDNTSLTNNDLDKDVSSPILPAAAAAKQQQQQQQATQSSSFNFAQEQDDQDIQQESMVLQALMQTNQDLDAVQQMEQTMVHITTLLSQFSNLVTEQQESIWDIHDNTKSTKDNIDQGQDNLVKATERTQQSKHYMATAIFAMGFFLLLVHWIKA